MKFLSGLALVSALTSIFPLNNAQAMPAVGDSAVFLGHVVAQGTTYQIQMALSLTAYDAATNSFEQVSSTTVSGRGTNTKTETISADELLSDATVDLLLADCANQGGVSETIVVAAGTFPTCRIVGDDGTRYNIGKVPFGIVKLDSDSTHLQLQSYSVGR